MKTNKIIMKRKQQINSSNIISLTQEAAECLVEILQETGLSAKEAASTIIIQAVRGNMIVYEND